MRFGWDDYPVTKHVEVVELGAWLEERLGLDPRSGLSHRDWLAPPQQLLLEVTAGAVFHDGLGELEPLRERSRWYPDEVWLWLLACQWRRIDQEEPFVGRTAEVDDDLGSRVLAARLVRDLMRLGVPAGAALRAVQQVARHGVPRGSTPHDAARPGRSPRRSPPTTIQAREAALVEAVEELARRHNALGLTDEVDPTVRLFHSRPFRVLGSGRFVDACLERISDPWLRALPLVGGIDQFVDSTDVLSDPGTRATRGWYVRGHEPLPAVHRGRGRRRRFGRDLRGAQPDDGPDVGRGRARRRRWTSTAPFRAARAAFEDERWRGLSPTRRGRLMMRLADLIAARAEEIAAIEVADNGKLYKEMLAQLRVIPEWLYYFGGLADKIEGRVIPLDRTSVLNYTLREPLGVVGIIVPWNSPVAADDVALAPALAAGNTIVVKPSEHARRRACSRRCGSPRRRASRRASSTSSPARARRACALVDHPGGREDRLHRQRDDGEADRGRGGGAPRAGLARARREEPEHRLRGRRRRGGRGGRAGRHLRGRGPVLRRGLARALAARDLRRAARAHARAAPASVVLGDPMADATQMGPIANVPQLERVESMVERRARRGRARRRRRPARGARRASRTASSTSRRSSTASATRAAIAQDEVFGPVLDGAPVRDEEEALALANATRFGLAAGVWTRDVKRAHRVAPAAAGGHGLDQHSTARSPSTRPSAATRRAATAA